MKQSKKLIFILLSFIIVMFSSTEAIVVSNKGSANLLTFESFYAYLVIIVFAIYNILKNKKSNLLIVLAMLTYAWTYLLIQQMINNITDVNITISNNFYLYLSSSVFLLFSLFINDNKKEETIEKLSSSGNDFDDSLFLSVFKFLELFFSDSISFMMSFASCLALNKISRASCFAFCK